MFQLEQILMYRKLLVITNPASTNKKHVSRGTNILFIYLDFGDNLKFNPNAGDLA